jgi:tetratricopeptide (TPR) repeat protein
LICFQSKTSKHYAGLIYIKQKKYDKAVKEFLKIIKSDEKFPNAYYNLALSYQMLNKFDEAIKYYLKSIELAQNEYDSFYNIGVIYLNQKDYEKAKETLKKASEADPEQPLAKFYMTYCDDQLSDYYSNEELAEKIINEYLSFEKYKSKIESYYS